MHDLKQKLRNMSEEERIRYLLARLYGLAWLVGSFLSIAAPGPNEEGPGFLGVLYLIVIIQAIFLFPFGELGDTFPATLCIIFLIMPFIRYSSFLHPAGWFFSFYKVAEAKGSYPLDPWRLHFMASSFLLNLGYWSGWMVKRWREQQ